MMALSGALIFAMVLARPMRGHVSHLAHARFRFELLVPLGFLLQLLPPALSSSYGCGGIVAVTLISWIAGAFVLVIACLLNWEHVGFRLAALGVALNGLVIVLNRGMPVSSASLRYLGLSDAAQTGALTPLYHLSDAETLLGILGDVLPVPGPPLIQSVVSLGDLLLMVGVAVIVLDGSRALAKSR
jgi:hypothetical protein